MRLIEDRNVVPMIEPIDAEAGIDSDSLHAGRAAHWDIVIMFGALTGDGVLTLYKGATAGAKTTAVPFRFRKSLGDFKAASADLFDAADTSDADGALTLTAATYDHRAIVIMLDSAELDDALPWITFDLSAAASVLVVSAAAYGYLPRLVMPVTVLA